MKKLLSVILCLLVHLSTIAQLSEANSHALRQELSQKINQLRIEKGLAELKPDVILRKAAKNQSDYMAAHKDLSHDQPAPELSTPSQRVKYFKGFDFEIVGENVLYSKSEDLPLSDERIISIANDMFLSWKNSPGHYANMIHPDYVLGEIAFKYAVSEKIIYATHVFGKKGIKIKGQLSPNSFGLTEHEGDCIDPYEVSLNLIANMGNTMSIEGNKVMFYYHNLSYFKKIFSNDDDGIAIDLVFRDQFECGKSNRVDFSSVHDGILLKPVFRNEILRNNTAQSDYRIISQVGIIPDAFLSKNISISVVLIKNGKMCKYLIPGKVPSKRYALKDIKPKLHNPESIDLIKSGIIESQELEYKFNTAVPTPIKFPKIASKKRAVHAVEISCFSLVEGDAERNALLHDKRAQNIKKHIERHCQGEYPMTIEAKENWEKMNFQLKYFFADELIKLSNDSMKTLLASANGQLPWDSLLFNQRKATATIHYRGVLTDSIRPERLLAMNLKTALYDKNFDLANKALAEIYETKDFLSDVLFEESVFAAIMKYPELTQNVSAVLSRYYNTNLSRTTEFLFQWLNQEALLSEEAKFNLLNLYTIVSQDLQYTWDLPAKRLSNVIHPIAAQQIMNDSLESDLVLNLNLIFIRYFGQINDGLNISKSFDFIAQYFRTRSLDIENEIDLVLFFNSWSRYDLTNKNLLKKYYDDTINEKALFILLKTVSFYNQRGYDISYYDGVYEKAFEMNPRRWCNLINEEFQILRDPDLKELFCRECKVHLAPQLHHSNE